MPKDHDSPMCQHGNPADDCTPCGLHRPVRNAYFDGKMLSARDLQAEQTYLNGLRHLGNMLLEGSGTVCGLKITAHPQDGCRSTHVVLTRGMALSCCGQEIIVPQDVTIPVLRMLKEGDRALREGLRGANDLVISLCREDRPTEMAPVLISDCCSGLDGQLPTRIAEDYGFRLSAVAPAARAEERAVRQPDLDWVHSINTLDERPTAVAVDEEKGLVYIASGLADRATIRGYRAETHALELTLPGWEEVHDIVAPRVGGWMFVAGRYEGGEVIALYPREPAHLASPESLITIKAPAQIAVSPATGALFALSLAPDATPTLLGWSTERLADAQAGPTVELSGGEPVTIGPQGAGCRVIEVSPDGRKLAFLLPGDKQALRITDVSELLGGGVASLEATAARIVTEAGDDVTASYAGAAALRFSYDGELLHLVGRVDDKPQQGFYRRVFLNEAGPTQTGRGLALALSDDARSWPALYIAPDERWIYLSTASERGSAGDENAMLSVYGTEAAKAPGATPPAAEPIQQIPLDAQLSGGALRLRGQRAYLPGFERMTAADDAPVRGRVMVVDISETDIGAIFEAAVEGCTTCGESCSCVPLAHLPGYVFSDTDPPRMLDPGEAGPGDVEIDNLTYRPIVPSNVTLMQAILEIAARGVESGPPGPRGEDGLAGQAGSPGAAGPEGAGITEVLYSTDVAAPTLEPITGSPPDQRLILPRPPAGADGPRGRSIAEVAFDSGVTPRLEDIGGPDSDLRLILPEPTSAPPVLRDPDDYQFVEKMNWNHGDVFALEDLGNGALPEMVVTLRRPVSNPDRLFVSVEGDVPHFYFSGVVEIRVHLHQDGVGQDGGFLWFANLNQSRTLQYAPRFDDRDLVFTGINLVFPMTDLWDGLTQAEITRARVETLLHGSFLQNDDRMPFDGRPEPQVTPEFAGVTGGTWRSWIEVLAKAGS